MKFLKLIYFLEYLSFNTFLLFSPTISSTSLHPIIDYPKSTHPSPRYDECNELIPSFGYRLDSYQFANNSLSKIMSPDSKDNRHFSQRCKNYIKQEYAQREKFRKMKRCEFLHLPKLCPKKPLSNEKLFDIQNTIKSKGQNIVILFILSHKPYAALTSVETILSSPLYFNSTIRFIFHLDSSSTTELWQNLTQFTSLYPDNTYLIPQNEAVDVEWGDITTAQAIYLSMKIAKQKWMNKLSTFVVLSETSLVVAPLTSIYLFFHRYSGRSYPGSKPGVVPSSDPVWKLCLNDVSIVCDRRVFHIGWRDHPISNEDGYFHGAQLFAFWSSNFIEWIIETKEGRDAYEALIQRLSQTATSDEFFWATLFYNSPFCHTLANIFDYKQGVGQELSAHVWSQECDSSDNWGKEACQSMIHQPIGWWAGNSPEWITFGDISQLIARQPLFVRKVKSDENECRQLLSLLHTAHHQVYNTLLPIEQQRQIIYSLFSEAQQELFSSSISPVSSPLKPPLSSLQQKAYYQRYRLIQPSDLLLSSDPDLVDEVASEIEQEYQELTKVTSNEPRYYLSTIEKKKSRGKSERLCVRIKLSNGGLDWVNCKSQDEEEMPTQFVLRNCIGNVTLHHQLPPSSPPPSPQSIENETCSNETSPSLSPSLSPSSSSSALITSATLPSGHLFGHCSLVSIGSIRTYSGLPFCLSPALLKFNSNYNKGPHPINYNDIHGQRISGSGIGFLPCDVDYSVGTTEQLFIFQKDSSIEYGTRFSREKEYIKEHMKNNDIKELIHGRVDGKSSVDPSLCVVKREKNQLGLLSCSEGKKRDKLTLILVN